MLSLLNQLWRIEKMKGKLVLCLSCTALVLSGCDTYEGQGAYLGSGIGAILGSSIGDLAGGWNGSDVGTIVGMAGGAAIGAAIGAQQDRQYQDDTEQIYHNGTRHDRYEQNGQANTQIDSDVSGFDSSNSGDDRIYDFKGKDYNDTYNAEVPESVIPSNSSAKDLTGNYIYNPNLEIRNARFIDSNRNNRLNRNEVCKVIFEIYNTSNHTMTDIVPQVVEISGNKHIHISPSIHVEKIDAGRGIRYTAIVKADGRLKDGNARFCVTAIQGNRWVSKISEFNIPTSATE